MWVNFATQTLRAAYEKQSVARGMWGKDVAKKYVQRVNNLYAAPSGQTLFTIQSLHFHPLKGERKGQYAMRLDLSWRLVVTFDNEAMTVVSVQEVSNHYGD